MDYRNIFGALAVLFSIISYIPYIRDIRFGKTRPHIISWSLWTIMTVIGVMAQISDNAGAAVWVGIVTIFICVYIIFLSIKNVDITINKIDIFSLVISLVALLSWYITDTPMYAVTLIVVADFAAFTPTLMKSYFKPYEETLSLYILSAVKHVFSLIALSNFTFITSAYSLYLVIVNLFFVGILFWRRSKFK